MKMFDSVVIACTQTTLELANAIRSSLEAFHLNVYLHLCVQKKNVLDVLAGKIPDSKYVVLCSSGGGFDVVEEINGKWEGTWVKLTPENVSKFVKLPGSSTSNAVVVCIRSIVCWST